MRPITTAHRRRSTPLTALLLIALVGGAMFVQAQGDAGVGSEAADTTVERHPREHLWARARMMLPRTHASMGGVRGGPPTVVLRGTAAPFGADHQLRGGSRDHGALFARWLDHAPDAGPVAPGLVGRVPDGTEVRLHLYDGDPAADGARLATLSFVAGSDDLAAFQADLREAASDATHVVVDVLGRTVALPEAAIEGDAVD